MELPKRKQIRLKNYDYSQAGDYFVTICTYKHHNIFGYVCDGKMVLSEYGKIVDTEWLRSEEIRNEIKIDKYIIMPNHIHGILVIDDLFVGSYGNTTANEENCNKRTYSHTSLRSPSGTIGAMVRGFKSSVTTKINCLRKTPQQPIWQRNYYDHIIRNETDYQRIWEYIDTNVLKWELDEYYKSVES